MNLISYKVIALILEPYTNAVIAQNKKKQISDPEKDQFEGSEFDFDANDTYESNSQNEQFSADEEHNEESENEEQDEKEGKDQDGCGSTNTDMNFTYFINIHGNVVRAQFFIQFCSIQFEWTIFGLLVCR